MTSNLVQLQAQDFKVPMDLHLSPYHNDNLVGNSVGDKYLENIAYYMKDPSKSEFMSLIVGNLSGILKP